MTVRDFLKNWPETRDISIYDRAPQVKFDRLYFGPAGEVPFALLGYKVVETSAQPNYKVTLYINTAEAN